MFIAMDENVQGYLDYLSLEKGLSSLSLQSYRSDIDKFERYVRKQDKGLNEIRQSDLSGFLDYLRSTGMAPSSIARHLSSIKGFFRYLNRTGETVRMSRNC
jgi:integrase/recombinase XerD